MKKRQLVIEPNDKHPFDLAEITTLGQDFRWRKLRGGWYSVVLDGNLIHMRQNDDGVEYESNSGADLNGLLCSYFRLDDDIDFIYDYISSRCDKVAQLVEKYPSHRILRQPDPWECMVAYICSANNNIPDICKSVEAIACRIGKPLELNGETRHAFPTPRMVLAADVGALEEVWTGLKSIPGYIIAASKRICDGELDLCRLAQPQAPCDEAKWQLMQQYSASHKVANGIGDKVADCIALFALDKMEAFPVDRHIKKAVQHCSPPPPSSSYAAIVKWAHGRFGEYAGYANQLLFMGAWDESQKSRIREREATSLYSDKASRAASAPYPHASEQTMTIRRLRIDQSTKYPFVLDKVLNGTQDFRWCRREDGWHCGVLAGHHIHARQDEPCVLIYRSDLDTDLTDLLHSYFRLDDDIDCIYDYISSRCDKVAQLVKEYPSPRLLRHPDPWECMVSYILSANSDVAQRIPRDVEKIAKKLGQPIVLDACKRYTFPTCTSVLDAGVEPLEALGLGLKKHDKIIDAARRVCGCKDKLDLCKLAQPRVPYNEAKRQLRNCYGIGPKIANCICLFSLDKTEAFPVDRHVRTAVAGYFPSQKPPSDEAIVRWAQERFGKYAGYAEQFLFYDDYRRSR